MLGPSLTLIYIFLFKILNNFTLRQKLFVGVPYKLLGILNILFCQKIVNYCQAHFIAITAPDLLKFIGLDFSLFIKC